MNWKKRLKDALYVGLGLFLIGILLLNADVSSTMETILSVDMTPILMVVALYFINTACKALRWYALLKGMGGRKLSLVLLPIFLSSLALNNSTPGKVGGEPVRALLLKEHTGNRVSLGVATIFSEKSLDMVMILLLAVLGVIYMISELGFSDVKWMALAVVIGGILLLTVIMLILSRRFVGNVTKILERLALTVSRGNRGSRVFGASEKLTAFMVRFHGSIASMAKRPWTSVGVVLMTIAIWLNEALRLFLIVNATPGNHFLSYPGAIAGIAVANILGFIFPMAGSGNVIGSKSVLDLLVGDENIALSSSLLQVATSLWISLPLGIVSLFLLRGRKYREGKGTRAD